jgi:PAS domain S-box-containing protein
MPDPIRVLIVEDNDDDAELILRAIRRGGFDPTYTRVENADDMAKALKESWNIVISDFNLPQFGGLDALRMLQETGQDVPFILVSGTIGEEVAVQALKAGAHDYLMKDRLTRLGSAIEREVREAELRHERAAQTAKMREMDSRNRSIVNMAGDGILTFGKSGAIQTANRSASRIFGIHESALVGLPLLDLLSSEGNDTPLKDGIGSQSSTGGPLTYLLNALHSSGTRIPVEVVISEVRSGKDVLYAAILRDQTERMASQAQIRWQFERLSALRAVDVAMTAGMDIQVTLGIVLDQVIGPIGADAACLLMVDRTGTTLTHCVSRGFRGSAIQNTKLSGHDSYAWKCLHEGDKVEIKDIRTIQPPFTRKQQVEAEGFVYYLAFPLIAKGKPRGVLEVFHREELVIDSERSEFAEALASQAAIAIENSELIHDLHQKNAELILAYDTTILGWSLALDLRDKETEGHSQRVTELSCRLAYRLGMTPSEITQVRRGAILHDIGKMGVADQILHKSGPLDEQEWEQMRKHPVYAYEWLSKVDFLRQALDIPYCHHERWDGSGYPRGLAGNDIPMSARLFAVIDVWDALTNDRPYRKAWPAERALAEIRATAGSHFDPDVVEEFMHMMGEATATQQDSGITAA